MMLKSGLRRAVTPKRFYKDATVRKGASGYQLYLDDRTLRTPARSDLWIPSRYLAEAIAAEFRAQEDKIIPATMPLMTIASTALDVTRGNEVPTIDRVLSFLQTDTVSFLHEDEPELRALQRRHWDPLRARANSDFGVSTLQTDGLVLREGQCQKGAANLRKLLEGEFDFWSLTTMEIATSYTKSAIIAVNLLKADLSVAAAVDAAQAEEIFQRNVWGTVEGSHDLAERETAMWLAACRTFDELRAYSQIL
jgi:chaperone required for assembly of F1-ATPase